MILLFWWSSVYSSLVQTILLHSILMKYKDKTHSDLSAIRQLEISVEL
jgi:hypothetical protein